MKTITVRDLKKAGFVHTPALDFGDDGTKFKMFTFRGVPVSYTKVDGEYYISIRFDYLDELTYDMYRAFPSYANADEFNGCSEVDLDKLVANCKAAFEDAAAYIR